MPLRRGGGRLEAALGKLSLLSALPASVEPPVSIARHGGLLAVAILVVALLDLAVRGVAFVLIYTLGIIAT